MFVAFGLSGVIPVVHGLILDGPAALDERMGLRYVVLEAFLYVFGAILYAVCAHGSSQLTWPIMLTLLSLVSLARAQISMHI